MKIEFMPDKTLQISDAMITYRNFEGRADQYNRAGDRNFALIIPDQEIADALLNDTNADGISWNVKIKAPREEGDEPFIYLPIKVKFNAYGPDIFLRSGNSRVRLNEDSVSILDDARIINVDLDIRPYDGVANGRAFRAAYLEGMEVTQKTSRFAEGYYEDRTESGLLDD